MPVQLFSRWGVLILTGLLLFSSACGQGKEEQSTNETPTSETFTLENGLRVLVVTFPQSEQEGIFTFLPMGCVSEGPDQAQFSHLIEHMVIRTTVPEELNEANAETLPDSMRLDTYGTVDNWEEGLAHHTRWIEGIPFEQERLQIEQGNVNSEYDYPVQNFATHKLAMMVWNQGIRHGRTHVNLHASVENATLDALQQQRDAHLVVPDRTLVCFVGGLDRQTIEPIARERLGAVSSEGKMPEPVELQHVDRAMTWELEARHLVLTWPIPSPDKAEYTSLMVAANVLMMRFANDAQLAKQTGLVLVGADLELPEGYRFFVSASLRPGASFDDVQAQIQRHFETIKSPKGLGSFVRRTGQFLASSLTEVPDPARLYKPKGIDPGMFELNLGLQYGMNEFRYGAHKSALAQVLKNISSGDVSDAVRTYLTDEQCAVCTISPPADADGS